jgi:deoxycytidylate deaminase
MNQVPNLPNWKLPYIPEGCEIFTVPVSDKFMQEAKGVCENESTDKKHSTGAVIVKDGRVLIGAANQSGFKSSFLIGKHAEGLCVRKFFNVPSGKGYWMCPGCSKSKHHAESGAVIKAMKKYSKAELEGATVYLYGHYWCCQDCWSNMLKVGINTVYVVENAHELFGRKK